MTLSRCGRVYPTFDAAYLAAQLRTEKSGKEWKVGCCPLGDHYHVVWPGSVMAPRKPARSDPFPPLIARLIDARDEGHCQRCGRSGRLERHHRRAKGSGGSKARSHTQCPCNALSLCRRCHRLVHEHPALARDQGWIVSQSAARPSVVAVARWIGLDDFDFPLLDEQWLTCDGRWVHSPLETQE